MADAPDALESIKELLAEVARETERLRNSQTQHAAMAVAGRMLAADLPSALIAQIQADLDSGDLNGRWLRAMERVGTESQAVVAVVGALMTDVAAAAARYVGGRAEEWEATAHQLEGRACALEAQSARLEEVRKAIARNPKA
jgi:hypothetical protein